MLLSIEVANYKSIEFAGLKFGNENVIVGPNGTGKSNLLDVLKFARDAVKNGLDEAVAIRHGIDSIRRWSKTRPYHLSIKIAFKANDNSFGYFKFVLSSRLGEFVVHEEEAEWTGPPPFRRESDPHSVTSRYRREADGIVHLNTSEEFLQKSSQPKMPESDLFMTQLGPNLITPQALLFRDLFTEISDYGAYSIYPNIIRSPQPINTNEQLEDDGANLASIIRKLRTTSTRTNKESLTSALAQVLPPLTEIRILTTGGFYVPAFKIEDDNGENAHYLNMSQVSDGTLRM